MGLKTNNYKVESLNLVLPEAYAYIIECHSDRSTGFANIGVFANRDDAKNPFIAPYEVKRVTFYVDRDTNDRITAYNKAKSQTPTPYYDPVTKEESIKYVDECFFGWEDDIQE